MIQRIQSLWLLGASVLASLNFLFPFYSGTKIINGLSSPAELDGGSTLFTVVLSAVLLVLAIIAIFLYKDRKRQLGCSIGGVILGIILVVVYFLEIKNFETGSIALWCVFAMGIPVFYFFAARGIWKDQKLVKSLDKLR